MQRKMPKKEGKEMTTANGEPKLCLSLLQQNGLKTTFGEGDSRMSA